MLSNFNKLSILSYDKDNKLFGTRTDPITNFKLKPAQIFMSFNEVKLKEHPLPNYADSLNKAFNEILLVEEEVWFIALDRLLN